MKISPVMLVFVGLLVAGGGAAGAECSDGSIRLTAEGTVQVRADFVKFRIEAVGRGRTQGDALADSDARLGRALIVLWDGGVRKDDLEVINTISASAKLALDGWEGELVRRRLSVSGRMSGDVSGLVKRVARIVDVDLSQFEYGLDDYDQARDRARAKA